jgi:hypothetical protein
MSGYRGGVRAKFLLPEALGTRGALGNNVVAAIDVEGHAVAGVRLRGLLQSTCTTQ